VNDQTSLDLLNDIVQPQAVGWWPPAPGWYVLMVLLGVASLVLAWRAWQKRKQNQYRRLALQELAAIRDKGDGEALGRIPVLLKRTALSAWPRSIVASMTGPDWHQFLDRTGGTNEFGTGAGQVLDRLSYGSGAGVTLSAAEGEIVLQAAEQWIRRHDTEARDA